MPAKISEYTVCGTFLQHMLKEFCENHSQDYAIYEATNNGKVLQTYFREHEEQIQKKKKK